MGGYGSGSHHYNKNAVEDGNVLRVTYFTRIDAFSKLISGGISGFSSVIKMREKSLFDGIETIKYYIGINDNNVIMNIDFTRHSRSLNKTITTEYTINIIPFYRHKRGVIYYFECPKCREYLGLKLYNSGSNYFACRKCLKLNYQSSKDSGKYKKLYAHFADKTGFSIEEVRRIFR